MRILFTLGSLDSGGAQRVAANLCNSFVKKGHSVRILVTKLKENLYKLDDEISVHELDSDQSKKGFFRERNIIKNLSKEIKEYKPTVVISFLPEPTARILFLKKFSKVMKDIPVILSVRADPNVIYKRFKRKMSVKFLYNKADGYVFQTEEAKEFFNKKIQDKSTIILNPINSNFFIKPFEGKREKVFVTVGRLTKQKNHELLISAFNDFQKEYSDYKLYIYGEGELEDKLKNQIKELNLIDKVILKGVSKNIPQELNNKYAFVLSSDFEGLPNALMEAMALGLPSISTDCTGGGARAVINDGVNGIIVPINDEKKLANAMKKIASDSIFAKKLGEEAMKIRDNCSEEAIVREWLNYINEFCRSK